jgi:hypothetical protein
MRFSLIAALLASFPALYADTTSAPPPNDQGEPAPWLTGPLLTPGGHVVPTGHINIEPTQVVNTGYGVYNEHWKGVSLKNNIYQVQTQFPMVIGLPWKLDIGIFPQWSWVHTHGASHWDFNDLTLQLDRQLASRTKYDWWPSVKFSVLATIPSGKYQHLNPHAKGTDLGGGGNWLPSAGFVFSHLFHLSGLYFINTRAYIQYSVSTSVHVKGLNAYGGGSGTKGTVYPGNQLLAQAAMELSLPYRFGLALDLQYRHTDKDRFKGVHGTTEGVRNIIGVPSREQMVLAPALEWSWSQYWGVIGGAKFSVAGRNAGEFVGAIVAVNMFL